MCVCASDNSRVTVTISKRDTVLLVLVEMFKAHLVMIQRKIQVVSLPVSDLVLKHCQCTLGE